MFNSIRGFLGFLVGLGLTVGLLLAPHLVPWDFGYGAGLRWPLWLILSAAAAGLSVLAGALWLTGRLVAGVESWKQGRFIAGILLVALTANTLYMFLVDLFLLGRGPRALVAALGVPVIYGNAAAVLGRTNLREAMASILAGALATMGAGFIIAAFLKGW